MQKCFLDLDGVIVDFVSGAMKAHGIVLSIEEMYEHSLGEWDFTSLLLMTQSEFWKKIDRDFWANLPWMPDGELLLNLLEKRFGRENICLKTSPCSNEGCYDGKLDWVKKHLPKHYIRHIDVGPMKHFSASQNVVLIDDSDSNVDKFKEHGGHAILVPRIWNRDHRLRHNSLQEVAIRLGI